MSNDKTLSKTQQNAKKRCQKIFTQLMSGCGKYHCQNPQCASNPNFIGISENEALKLAINKVRTNNTNFIVCKFVKSVDVERIENLSSSNKINELCSYVLKTFSSTDVLQISFLAEGKTIKQITGKNGQIDFKKLNAIYKLLLSKPSTKNVLLDALVFACHKLLAKTTGQNHRRFLRSVVVLVLNPLFSDPKSRMAFLDIAKAISALSTYARADLVQSLCLLSAKMKKRVTEMILQNANIEVLSRSERNYSPNIGNSIDLLELMHRANSIQPFVNYSAFYCDAINEDLMNRNRLTSFLKVYSNANTIYKHNFILDTAVKSRILRYESKVKMQTQYGNALVSAFFDSNVSPFLQLKVRRDNMVHDTLQQLHSTRKENFKKPLKVVFRGEYGVDEGGLKKEFFQIIVRQLFLPDYGMFEYSEDSRLFWFNKDTIENNSEFELIGVILGLAIYNGVILNLHFPKVVYMKLLDFPVGTLEDLRHVDRDLANGLQNLLAFEGDVEATFMRNFCVEYDSLGAKKVVELKPGGKEIPLTNENRIEYVDLYVNYVLNRSIKEQFHKFYKGFHTVCDSNVFNWLHWEELELLICGSNQLDFKALEKSCRYQDGYTQSSPTIKMFWEVVHAMTEDEKKNFLFFTTGSDRVPIRGLGDLTLHISRNGDDQRRLPSAHTCFNHLLLPHYRAKEVLSERLRLAILNSEGFGMH